MNHDIIKNGKYLWFYPKNKTNIKLILQTDSLSSSKQKLKDKFKKYDCVDLILLEIKSGKTINKLFPTNIYFIVKFYNITNDRFSSIKNKHNGIIFYDKKSKLKITYLKKIIKLFYFFNLETKPLEFKFYSDL